MLLHYVNCQSAAAAQVRALRFAKQAADADARGCCADTQSTCAPHTVLYLQATSIACGSHHTAALLITAPADEDQPQPHSLYTFGRGESTAMRTATACSLTPWLRAPCLTSGVVLAMLRRLPRSARQRRAHQQQDASAGFAGVQAKPGKPG